MIYNNADTTLLGSIGLNATTFLVKTGEGALFPTTNFTVFAEQRAQVGEELKVVKRTAIFCTSRSGDIFTVGNLNYEACVQDDTQNPKTRSQNKLTFTDGATIRQYTSEKLLNAIALKDQPETITEQYDFTKGITYGQGIRVLTSEDWNDIVDAGFYRGSGVPNAPTVGGWYHVTVESHDNKSYCHQTATSWGVGNTENQVYSRVLNNDVWSSWEKLIVGGVPKLSDITDGRGFTKNPIDYQKTVEFEFKNGSEIGSPGGTSLYGLLTLSPWSDTIANTGIVHQYAYSRFNGEVFHRWSLSNTSWTAWKSDNIDTVSQTFTTGGNTGTITTTYNHSLGYTPRRIDFVSNSSDNQSFGTYTAEDNKNTCAGKHSEGNFFQTSFCIYTRSGSGTKVTLTGKVTAVTSTTFSVQYVNPSLVSGFQGLDILAILS